MSAVHIVFLAVCSVERHRSTVCLEKLHSFCNNLVEPATPLDRKSDALPISTFFFSTVIPQLISNNLTLPTATNVCCYTTLAKNNCQISTCLTTKPA